MIKTPSNRGMATAIAVQSPEIPTVIEFLLDETGSMSSHLKQTLGGFRNFVNEQRSTPGECQFTLTKFDTNGFRNPYTDLDISMVPYLNENTFIPGATTNLRDAIMYRLDEREKLLQTNWSIRPRIMFVCLTDGGDNASRKSVSTVRDRIVSTINDQDWAFVYLGAFHGAIHAARELGFPENNIKCFGGNDIQHEMETLSVATKAYRAGVSKATDFYASTTV